MSGPDAITFLQGQVSADVVTLEPGQSTLALLLAPTGKTEALVRIWRTGEQAVVMDTDAGAGDVVEARLRRFQLRTDVTIEALDWDCVAIRGPGAMDVDVDACSAELLGLGMWPGIEGVDLLGPAVSLPEGVAEASPEILEVLRITAGWPRAGSEIHDGVIPAEIGPWLITAAVSFTKGCYVGQELTARIDSRGGNVPRHLRVIELGERVAAQPGDDIVVSGEASSDAVGVVTSCALDPGSGRGVAMGFVKRSVPVETELVVRPRLNEHVTSRPRRSRFLGVNGFFAEVTEPIDYEGPDSATRSPSAGMTPSGWWRGRTMADNSASPWRTGTASRQTERTCSASARFDRPWLAQTGSEPDGGGPSEDGRSVRVPRQARRPLRLLPRQ